MGIIYNAGNDGGNTQIRYNWVFNNPGRRGYNLGIYLDNYTKNYLVHHNIVWNVPTAIRLNRPTGFIMVLNNTVFSEVSNQWGPWPGPYVQWGCHLINNLSSSDIRMNPEVSLLANQVRVDEIAVCFDTLHFLPGKTCAGRGEGIHVPGYTLGENPDIGAIQSDQPAWKPGHDFDDPPDPVYEPAKTPLRNHLRNAAFEYNRYYEEAGLEANPLIYWKKTGTAQAGIHLFPGFNFPHADERNSIHGNSLKLSGGNGGVEQVVEGLSPNTSYYFSGYVRHPDEVNVEFSVTGKSGSKVTKTSDHAIRAENSPWRFVILKYTTGPTENSTKVSITKEGQGDVYVDDTGFVPAAWLKHINIPDTEAKIQVRKIY